MTQVGRIFVGSFVLFVVLGLSVEARAAENAHQEPWKFNGESLKTGDYSGAYEWEIYRKNPDNETYRKDKDGKELKGYSFMTVGMENKEAFETTLAKKHKVDKTEADIEKEIIAIVNKFNKLDGAKAISKVDIGSQYYFTIRNPGDHLVTPESERQAFFRFMTIKHKPIELESVERNAKDEPRMQDSCVVLVRYEHSEVESMTERNKMRRAAREKGEALPKFGLKTEVLYLDQHQGDSSQMHFMDKDGNWETMMQR